MQFACSKPLTHTAEHGQDVHRGAEGPGHDFGWLESHLHRPQSNSATVERHCFSAVCFAGKRSILTPTPVLRTDCIWPLLSMIVQPIWHVESFSKDVRVRVGVTGKLAITE